jgi:hypothetical protein
MEPESVLKILIVYLNLSLPPKNSGMGLGLGIIKNTSKIIKEQLPLKQNMERNLSLQFLSYN